MQRTQRSLLIAVLFWLVPLSTGVFHCQPQNTHHHSSAGGHKRGHRPFIPAKKGTTLPSEDEEVNPSRLARVHMLERVAPAPVLPCAGPGQHTGLAWLGFPGQPLYLTLRTLLI
jgi:hypothetical protein